MSIRFSLDVRRPRPEVYAVFSRVESWAQRVDPNVVAIDRMGEGPLGVGTVLRERVKVGPREDVVHLRLIEFAPPVALAWSISSSMLAGRAATRFAEHGGVTTVTTTLDMRPRGLAMWIWPLLRLWLPRAERARFRKLGELIERGELPAPQTAARAS